jgi:hypothetical protein
VYLNEQLSTEVKKSDVFERVLIDLRKQEKFVSLKGWRNEVKVHYTIVNVVDQVQTVSCNVWCW